MFIRLGYCLDFCWDDYDAIDFQPKTSHSSGGRDDGSPGECAQYGGEWDTGGLLGKEKCVYNKTDESDNKEKT
ncbi:hypothetical protein [Bacillus cereus]|uniref:hypothetical protein n=1 Tax=Bacillus cereus TaxID=1396 RepID=UPI00187A21BB|nr:hypothetical protein [Bacillus cereus]MBE7123440.1 hypothetical protein [Bacillus cereus]